MTVCCAQLMDILKDRPKLDTIARHQTHSAFDWGQMPKGCKLIEQIKNQCRRLCRITSHFEQALRDKQAQPARIGREAVGRKNDEHRHVAALEIRKPEIRATEDGRHAW